MKSFLAIDVETTGLDPVTDKIIEVGWALFDIEAKKLAYTGGMYLNREGDDDDNAPDGRVNFSDVIYQITRIEREWLKVLGRSERDALHALMGLAKIPGLQAVVAHNAAFDRAFLEGICWQYASPENGTLPWICTQNDLPGNVGNKSLRYLALDRNVLSFFPHRAQFDAVQCGAILNTFDFDEVLTRSKSPTVYLAADVTFKENQKAKALDFRWERPTRHGNERVPKTWVKALKEMDRRAEEIRCGEAGVMTHVVPAEKIVHDSNNGNGG